MKANELILMVAWIMMWAFKDRARSSPVSMKILCVIPSRIHSTRLPRKALLPIQGKPMIQWTYENALRCRDLTDVVVATDSTEVGGVIAQLGGKVEMTDADLATGSLRVATVAERYPNMDIVINLQGDEPFIQPYMLTQLIAPFFTDKALKMTTLAYPLSQKKYHSPDCVKVITDLHHHALYFSRSLPSLHHSLTLRQSTPVYNHMGVYGFRRDFLMLYKTLPQTPLEQAESLEQLRVLEHGFKIKVCLTQGETLEVNTQEEYEQAQHFEYI